MPQLGRLTVLPLRLDQQMIGSQDSEKFIPSYSQDSKRFFQQVIYSYARHDSPYLLHERYDLCRFVLTASYAPPVTVVLLT